MEVQGIDLCKTLFIFQLNIITHIIHIYILHYIEWRMEVNHNDLLTMIFIAQCGIETISKKLFS